MPSIAHKLKELRKSKSLSQKEVSMALKINERTYCRYETDKFYPSMANIKKLAKFFRVSVDYLLDDSEDLMHHQDNKPDIAKEILDLVELLPEYEQRLVYELVKGVVLTWDNSFNELTPTERKHLEDIETL